MVFRLFAHQIILYTYYVCEICMLGINMSVERMKKKIRKMSYREKLELMNWLNAWYSYLKEEE